MKQLIDILEKFITEFREQNKESLQRGMLNSLSTLFNKKDSVEKGWYCCG